MNKKLPDSYLENYKYWQENGEGWFEEYERRKTFILYFHFQEILLSQYMANNSPARVLEFGSGVGRHLRNLRNIAGIDIYGFDQSPTMIKDMAAWAPDAWIASHISLGKPIGPLPFEDDSFDIVYTSEVLVHVRPDDILYVIKEICRVARRRILHIEPLSDADLVIDAHNGCWGHDLKNIYSSLGMKVNELPRLFQSQSILEISLDGEYSLPPISQETADLFRRMEEYVSPRLNRDIFEENLFTEEKKAINQGIESMIDLNNMVFLKPKSEISRQGLTDISERLLSEIVESRKNISYLSRSIDYLKDHIAYLQLSSVPSEDGMTSIKLTLDDKKNEASNGQQMWVRFVRVHANGPMLPWSAISHGATSRLVDSLGCMSDQALLTEDNGRIEFSAPLSSRISFMGHAWSGQVIISIADREKTIDLYRAEPCVIDVDIADI